MVTQEQTHRPDPMLNILWSRISSKDYTFEWMWVLYHLKDIFQRWWRNIYDRSKWTERIFTTWRILSVRVARIFHAVEQRVQSCMWSFFYTCCFSLPSILYYWHPMENIVWKSMYLITLIYQKNVITLRECEVFLTCFVSFYAKELSYFRFK